LAEAIQDSADLMPLPLLCGIVVRYFLML
jgi:hypothetical protein